MLGNNRADDTARMDAPRDNRPSARAAVALFAVAAALLFCARQFVVVRDDWLTLWQLAQEIVLFGLPWAAYYQLKPDAKPFTRMARVPRIGTCVAAALAALIGLEYFSGLDALWVTLLTRLGLNLDTLSQWLAADTGMDMPTALLIMAAAPALFEELSFRGLTLPALERYGAGRAAVISGLLFALTHMSLPGLPTHLLLGVALAMLAIASDSLVLPMVYHFAHNAGAVAVSYFVQYDTDVALREMISRETTLTVFIQTAVSFALWGLMMRMVFTGASRGRGEQAAEAVKAARFPRGLMIVIILLVLLLLSVYALQLIALM